MAVKCVDIIKNATGLSDRDAARIIRELEQEVRRRGVHLDPDTITRLAQEQKANLTRYAQGVERRVKISAVKIADQLDKLGEYKDRTTGIHSAIRGTNENVGGSRYSTEARIKALRGDILESFLKDVDNEHDLLSRALSDKRLNEDTVRELWNFTDAKTTKAVTKNPEALHLASVMDKHAEMVRKLANQEGADIERLPGHQSVQTHNPRPIVNAGFEQWAKDIAGELDTTKTFGGQDVKNVLRSVYDKIEADKFNVFTGEFTGSTAERMGKKRFLIFKDADSWMRYDKKYGTGTGDYVKAYLNNLQHRIHEVGLMQDWGPDPDNAFDRYMRRAAKSDTASAKDKMGGLSVELIKAEWAALTMADRAPGNPNFAAFMSGARKIVSMAKLGGAVVSSFSDINTRISTAQYNGIGALDSIKSALSGPEITPRTARFFKSFSEGFLAEMHGRFTAEDGIPGRISQASNLYYKLNLLTPWTDFHKGGYAWMAAQDLGDHAGIAWGSLPDNLRANLNRYGLDEGAWKKIQAHGGETVDGTRFVTPDMISDRDVSLKLRAWFMNEADFAVPTPGVAERAVALWGTRPGTITGEVMRSIAQFKMFPIATMMRTLPRAKQMGAPGMVQFAVGALAMGYLSISAKAVIQGKPPPDPRDLRTVVAAATASGGLGILGDLLITDFTATGRSLAEVAAGPLVGGGLGDAARLWAGAWRGEDKASKTLDIAIKNTPFANIFWLKTALNYLGVYHVQEKLNPGYLRRQEQRLKQETGQDYWMKPSDIIRYGGGF